MATVEQSFVVKAGTPAALALVAAGYVLGGGAKDSVPEARLSGVSVQVPGGHKDCGLLSVGWSAEALGPNQGACWQVDGEQLPNGDELCATIDGLFAGNAPKEFVAGYTPKAIRVHPTDPGTGICAQLELTYAWQARVVAE